MQALKAVVMLALMELKISEGERRGLKAPVPTTTDAFLEVSSVKCGDSNNYCGHFASSTLPRGLWYGRFLFPTMPTIRKPPKRRPKPPPKKNQQNQNKSTTRKTSTTTAATSKTSSLPRGLWYGRFLIPTMPTIRKPPRRRPKPPPKKNQQNQNKSTTKKTSTGTTTAPTTTVATTTTTTAATTTVACIRTAISYDECINYEGDQSTVKNSIPEATTEPFNIVPFQDQNKYCGRFQLNVFHVGVWQELYLFPNATKIFAEKRRRHMPPTKKKKKKIYPNLKGKPHWPR